MGLTGGLPRVGAVIALLGAGFVWAQAPQGVRAAPGAVDVVVASGADDIEEQPGGWNYSNSTDIELTDDFGQQAIGLRFTGVDIPRGAEITSASVQFTTDEANGVPTDLTVSAALVGDISGFANSNPVTGLPTSTSTVSWSPPPWSEIGAAGADQRTPDLSAVIEEIVNLPDWAAGNALAVLFSGVGERTAYSYEGSPALAPRLLVEFVSTTPPTTTTTTTTLPPTTTTLPPTTTTTTLPPTTTTTTSLPPTTTSTTTLPATTTTTSAPTTSAPTTSTTTTTTTVEPTTTTTIPGSVDQGSADVSIASASDDAEELSWGYVVLDSSDLEIVRDVWADQHVGLRFDMVPIPDGAVVTDAWIQFTVDEVGDVPTTVSVAGLASPDTPTFAPESYDVSSRPTTASAVGWSPSAWSQPGAAGAAQRTPDLSSIVQDVVDQPGWTPGNAVGFVITGSGTRTAHAVESGAAGAAVLHVEWESSGTGGGNQAPSIAIDPPATALLPDGVAITASADDDGLPGPLTVQWEQISGPGSATFSSPTTAQTEVDFTERGDYVLRLVASDGQLTTTDEVTVTAILGPGHPTVRLGVVGDYGEYGPNMLAVASMLDDEGVDIITTVGDNRYGFGTLDANIGQAYGSYIGEYTGAYGEGSDTNRFFPSIGNHDYDDGLGLPGYVDFFDLPGANVPTSGTSGSERYYDVQWGPAHLFVLNPDVREPDGWGLGSVQAQWLETQLGASDSDWQIVVLHYPPYGSGGNYGSNAAMQLPYAAWGADMVMSGDDHLYERLEIDGIPYFVNGLGGVSRSGLNPPIAASQFQYNDRDGAMVLDICPGGIESAFVSVEAGMSLRLDPFTIGAGCP